MHSHDIPIQTEDAALDGLKHLALGSCNDAVALMLTDTFPSGEQLREMDLFGVSSIKRDKTGGMEIHFFDRLKALAALHDYTSAADNSETARSLLAALMDSGEVSHEI